MSDTTTPVGSRTLKEIVEETLDKLGKPAPEEVTGHLLDRLEPAVRAEMSLGEYQSWEAGAFYAAISDMLFPEDLLRDPVMAALTEPNEDGLPFAEEIDGNLVQTEIMTPDELAFVIDRHEETAAVELRKVAALKELLEQTSS